MWQSPMQDSMADLYRYRPTSGKRNFIEQIKAEFLGYRFSNRDNVRAPIQFRRESQPQHLKRWFLLKNRLFHFHISNTSIIRPVKQNQLSFSGLKSTSYFLPQSTVSCRSDSSLEANSSCCYRWDVWSYLE